MHTPSRSWYSDPVLEKRRGGTSAFTLIELLVVTAILAVVVGAIGACLAGGIRVWDVARRFNRDEADAMMGFQVMRRDIGGLLAFEGGPFVGARDTLQFTGISVVAGTEERDEMVSRLSRVRYFFDRDRRAWCRTVAPFSWSAENPVELAEILVSDVDHVALRYGAAPEDASSEAPAWSDTWGNPTNLPAVVEADLLVGGTAMTQWFLIPLGNKGIREPGNN